MKKFLLEFDGSLEYIWIKINTFQDQMGLWCSCLCLVIILVVSAEERNSTIKHSDRRGKALKISKKPCSDPNGRKGICTFKWDCINHNGTLMGTCVDGFIFGTCCQYNHDPLLNDDVHSGPFNFEDTNSVLDDRRPTSTTASTTRRTTTTTTTTSTSTTTTTTTLRPTQLFHATTKRPLVSTTASPTVLTTSRPSEQLVTWTSIGPTRRPVPQRPIILSPFPFRPGVNFPSSQGGWPVGIAFPVDPFQLNRPLQPFQPSVLLQNAQNNVANQVPQNSATTSFTILNGPDRSTQRPSTTVKNSVEMTTISVPIPQWSTQASGSSTSTRPADVLIYTNSTTPRPLLLAAGSSTVSGQSGLPLSAAATTKAPVKNLDYRKDCGVRALGPKARIVGGQSAFFGRWPWQVLVKEAAWLGLYQKNKCGGVLISSRYVVTAGHCQPGRFLSSLMVILGEHDLLTDFERLKPEMRRVKRMIVHRHYNPQNFDNDIALLELDPPVIFRPHISPICLPAPDEDFTGRMAYVTGWGKTAHGGAIPNLLQEVQVPIMSNARCVEMFKEAGHAKLIKDSFLCAGYQSGGKDSCEGDSGGPLMVERESGQWVLAGTVSHGIRCADPNLPGVYMRISAYRPWIDKIIK